MGNVARTLQSASGAISTGADYKVRATFLADLKFLPTLLPNSTDIMFSNRYFFGFYYFTPPA
jgi:hypothetical protein